MESLNYHFGRYDQSASGQYHPNWFASGGYYNGHPYYHAPIQQHLLENGQELGWNYQHQHQGYDWMLSSPGYQMAEYSEEGSDLSASPSASNRTNSPAYVPVRSKSPYEWMKKTPLQSEPSPAGKTRTKDKYRVVYTDQQRVELEKEFLFAKYITIRRKTELAAYLGLSERQVKIWFQNRRAKERKQVKKKQELQCRTELLQPEDRLDHLNTRPEFKVETESRLHHL